MRMVEIVPDSNLWVNPESVDSIETEYDPRSHEMFTVITYRNGRKTTTDVSVQDCVSRVNLALRV